METKKVLVASNHGVVRHGLRLMLAAATTHVVAVDARELAELPAMLAEHQPDILIADLSTRVEQADEAIAMLEALPRDLRVVVICTTAGQSYERQLKRIRMLSVAVLEASSDAQQILDLLSSNMGEMPSVGPLGVTPREREIIQLVTQGLCNKRIARALNISVTTVRTHRQKLMAKLGLRNAVEIAQFAARANLVTPRAEAAASNPALAHDPR